MCKDHAVLPLGLYYTYTVLVLYSVVSLICSALKHAPCIILLLHNYVQYSTKQKLVGNINIFNVGTECDTQATTSKEMSL